MSLALHYWMGRAHRCSGPPVSEMTDTVRSCFTIIFWTISVQWLLM